MKRLKIFQNSEMKLLEPICNFKHEGDFIVYKSDRLPFYRLANGIFIIKSNGRHLRDWEELFGYYFDKGIHKHRTFTFFNSEELDLLKKDAIRAGWQEVKSYSLEICVHSPYKDSALPDVSKIYKIEDDKDWEKYRLFKKGLHDDYWAQPEGFKVIRHISESLKMERFYIQDSKAGKMISTLALLNSDNFIRIENVETHPDHRRKGLASYLLTFAIRYSFNEIGSKGIILDAVNTDTARSLYSKLGFETVGEKVLLMKY